MTRSRTFVCRVDDEDERIIVLADPSGVVIRSQRRVNGDWHDGYPSGKLTAHRLRAILKYVETGGTHVASKRATLPVVEKVLRRARRPLCAREIVERAGDKLPSKSRLPATVVTRDLSMEIRDNPRSKFRRVSRGLYTLKEASDAR